MSPLFDADTLLQVVLPKLLRMSLVSFMVGSVVGAVVAAIDALIRRSRLRRSGSQPQQAAVSPASLLWSSLWGSFLGTFLIGLLPIEANPASLIGGPYGALWFGIMLLIFVPAGATTGAVLALIAAGTGRLRPNLPRVIAGSTVLAYLISTLVLALLLALPTIGFSTAPATGPFPLVARLTLKDSPPLDRPSTRPVISWPCCMCTTACNSWTSWSCPYRSGAGSATSMKTGGSTNPSGCSELRGLQCRWAGADHGRRAAGAGANAARVKTRLRLDGATVAYPMADRRLVTQAAVDALAPSLEPQSLKDWAIATGQLLRAIPADLSTLDWGELPIAVRADRRLLAFPRRLYDNQIQVWNIVDNKLSSTISLGSPAGILSLAFSPEGGQLAVALGQGPPLAIWDLVSARQTRAFDAVDRAQQLHWTDKGHLVGSGCAFKVLNPRSGNVLHTLRIQPAAPLPQATFDLPLGLSALSGDGSTLAAYVPRQGIGVWRVGLHHPS